MEFRFRAMRQAHDPNNLDTTVNLASPRSWIALWVTFFVVVAAIVWAFVGTIPQSVVGSGVLTRADGVVRLQAGSLGTVTALQVRPQTTVRAGQTVATVTDTDGRAHDLVAPAAGTVLLADVPPGTSVTPTDQVVVIERDTDADLLQAAVVVPQTAATRLYPGLEVSLSVGVAPSSQFGLLRGRVSAIGSFPTTAGGLSSLFLDEATTTKLLSGGAMCLVTIDLVADAGTVSGYAWTSAAGPPFVLRFQDVVTATVHLPDRSPVEYLLGDL